MRRTLFVFLFCGSLLFSQSYKFSEERYSDAIERSVILSGEIEFSKNTLSIEYIQNDTEIVYEDGIISLSQNKELRDLDPLQEQQMARYFDILLLLHEGNAALLEQEFLVTKKGDEILLLPKGEAAKLLEKIVLKGFGKDLKEVKLFMKNLDRVTIKIEDEIS